MTLVWKLLRQHISVPQFFGFFVANLVGMLIILVGVQFYTDIQAVYTSEDSFMKADYMIVNKQVGAMSTVMGRSDSFTDDEISDLTEQPFVTHIGTFTPSAYDVRASFDIDGLAGFSTEMFFESVPDEFVDVESDEWAFHPADTFIPIILPKNYLDLYNFGYAQSRSLPHLSEGILGAIRLNITISGGGETARYEGRIVGFSSRLNTILVPEAFMTWANSTYAPAAHSQPTRIIMQVSNPTDEAITQYLQDNGYETDADKLNASKTNYVLKTITGIVMSVGFVICILSFYILMLSIYLLLQKNSQKLENLLIIGYSPARVAFPYQTLTAALSVIVLLAALASMLCIRSVYLAALAAFFPDMATPSVLPSVLTGIALLILVSLLNIFAIRRKVMQIWYRKD